MERAQREVVRAGYDAMSWVYRGDDDAPVQYRRWTETVLGRLPRQGCEVLDLGCGCGVPVARDLALAGHHVTGVDISPVQIERARTVAPTALFLQADLVDVEFPSASFDAVISLYALIHLTDREQQRTIERTSTWLRPGGTVLATIGAHAYTGTDPDWLGTGDAMWWNHPDPAAVRGWMHAVGMTIDTDCFIPEGAGGHQLLVARGAS